MGYCGTRTIEELRTKARFIQVTARLGPGKPSPRYRHHPGSPNYSSFTSENETGRGSV